MKGCGSPWISFLFQNLLHGLLKCRILCLACGIRSSGTIGDEQAFRDSFSVYFNRHYLLETVLEVGVLEGNLCCPLKDYMIGSGLLIQPRRNPGDIFEVI